jgi:ADP-heptose:LPS heptosyltransferase
MKSRRQRIKDYFNASSTLRRLLPTWGHFKAGLKLHAVTLAFILRVLVPMILQHRRRPVLFVRHVGIGDIICTFPTVQELKRRHLGAPTVYSCYAGYACLPALGQIVDATAPFSAEYLKKFWGWWFSAIYQFEFGDDKAFHVSSEILIEGFARQFGASVSLEHPTLVLPAATLNRVKKLLAETIKTPGPVVLLHPGPSWPIREWPAESWVKLASQLKLSGYEHLIQIGTVANAHIGGSTVAVIPGAINFINLLSLEETAALIALSDLLIGIDSGLLHIAASLRIPAVGIFGPTSPQLRFSSRSSCSFVVSEVECQGCHHRLPCLHWINGCPHNIKCMKAISAQDVLATSLAKLSTYNHV